jgi:hypothetical protein
MRNSWRFLTCVIALGAALVCLGRCVPHPTLGPTPDPSPPAAPGELNRQLLARRELDQRFEVVRNRLEARNRIVDQVLAGRLTLLEAATQFRGLFESPEARATLRRRLPGVPYEQALCRQVIFDVRASLELGAVDAVGNVLARLEAELAEHLNRHGEVHLLGPAPPPTGKQGSNVMEWQSVSRCPVPLPKRSGTPYTLSA